MEWRFILYAALLLLLLWVGPDLGVVFGKVDVAAEPDPDVRLRERRLLRLCVVGALVVLMVVVWDWFW